MFIILRVKKIKRRRTTSDNEDTKRKVIMIGLKEINHTPLHKCIIKSRWLGDKLLTELDNVVFFISL